MVAISLKAFGGAIPRLSPRLLQQHQSVDAVNTKLDSGELRPWDAPLFVETPTKVGTKESIYRWGATPDNPSSGFWFHWIDDVNVIQGPVSGDTVERTYFTGDGVPKMTYSGIATSGGTNYPTNDYDLGLPAPSAAPNAVTNGIADPAADPIEDAVERAYCVTYVSGLGEEGPPSALSSIVSWLPGQTVDLSAIPTAPTGSYNVTHVRIYRVATGASGSALYYVDQIAIGTSTYNDAIDDSALSELLSSEQYYQPPEDMHSIGVLSSGMAYGFSGKNVCVSELYLPHAWNPDNQLPIAEDIIGGGHFGNNVVAITREKPYIISGIDPLSMSADEYNIKQGCMSKRSCVSTRYGVIYASPDGLILIGPNGDQNLTAPYLRPEQWAALKPSSILGAVYDNMYVGFYDNGTTQGGFIIDPGKGDSGFIYLDTYATAAYRDPLADTLYLVVGDDIVAWDRGTALSYTWLSKEFTLPQPRTMATCRVLASDYSDITVKVYADGVSKVTQVVTDDKPFRMPTGYRARTYQVEITGTSPIQQVDLAETPTELYQA